MQCNNTNLQRKEYSSVNVYVCMCSKRALSQFIIISLFFEIIWVNYENVLVY